MRITKRRALLLTSAVAAGVFVALLALIPVEQAPAPGGNTVSASARLNVEVSAVFHHVDNTGALTPWRLQLANPMYAFCSSGLRYGAANYTSAPASCAQGWSYWQDPTTVMTNNGHEFFGCKFFNVFNTITCTAADFAQYMMLSSSASVPAVTDTACLATTYTTGNLADVAGTITAPAASGGSETWTITHTWTANTNSNTVGLMCLNTEAHAGANVVLTVEGQVGPDTLNTNDQFVGTFTFQAT